MLTSRAALSSAMLSLSCGSWGNLSFHTDIMQYFPCVEQMKDNRTAEDDAAGDA